MEQDGERFREAKVRTTKLKVDELAFEAFPAWGDIRDAWGKQLGMRCGSLAPPEARGFGVASAGENGKEEAADDITSWRVVSTK